MIKIIIIVSLMALATAAEAASNAQRMTGGGMVPVFVNGTGTHQIQSAGVYVNQTQFTPAAGGKCNRELLGVGC